VCVFVSVNRVVVWSAVFVMLKRLLIAFHHLGKRHLVINHRRWLRRSDFEGLFGRAKCEFRNQARSTAIALQSEAQLALPEPPPTVAAVLVRRIENVKQGCTTAPALHLARRTAIVRGGFVAGPEKGYACCQLSISIGCHPMNISI
jgi:hypothetical protein